MSDTTFPDDLITVPAAAKLLGCHLATVRRWLFRGKLQGWRVGRRYRVSRAELLACVQRVEPRPAPLASRRERTREEKAQARRNEAARRIVEGRKKAPRATAAG